MTILSKPLHEAGKREWFSLDRDVAEIMIYDEIGRGFYGGGIPAEGFIEEVKGLSLKGVDRLRLRINSPGGDVFDGNAIYNYLRSQSFGVDVLIDGVAASAASVVAMAGDTISMPENAMMMIHNPWTVVVGDANTMRDTAERLDKIREGAVNNYFARVGDKLSKEEIITLMDEETWMTAEDAIDKGFADELLEPVKAAALLKFDLGQYGFHEPKIFEELKASYKDELAKRREMLAELNSA